MGEGAAAHKGSGEQLSGFGKLLRRRIEAAVVGGRTRRRRRWRLLRASVLLSSGAEVKREVTEALYGSGRQGDSGGRDSSQRHARVREEESEGERQRSG